jgi:hypothetical protein
VYAKDEGGSDRYVEQNMAQSDFYDALRAIIKADDEPMNGTKTLALRLSPCEEVAERDLLTISIGELVAEAIGLKHQGTWTVPDSIVPASYHCWIDIILQPIRYLV